ncbi:MAG: NADPH-dependent glutamate synthase [Muribaculaceae bacterium]|nr:NADPH-dependent glutamate synthase [Muribaculaceae bacterium]
MEKEKDTARGRNDSWREELRRSMSAAERTAIPRVSMRMLDPAERIHSNSEVNLGLTPEQALQESTRCLDCPEPGCITGCPVSIDIPGFIKNIQRGNLTEAARILKETSALPAVCGRVCPQEKQCESRCIYLRMKKSPVAIGWLERYAADEHLKTARNAEHHTDSHSKEREERRKIAVVGSGPAGLSFAGDMVRRGYDVVVYEALHEIGGVLKYGIPEFRLPNSVVEAEIEALRDAGVTFHKDTVIGKTLSYDDLLNEGFSGIFVASGAGLPRFMGIPGENLIGVLSSNEFLTRVNLMGAGRPGAQTPVPHGKCVAVIGGGNTAMDSVRTSLRLGAERAMIIYRRGIEEMPARAEEVEHAMQEGVEFLTLCNPIEYIGDEKGRVRAIRVQRMTLGEPDASGRRSPVPVEGAVDTIEVDEVIVSVGVSPNPLIPNSIDGLEISSRGTICVNEDMQSSLPLIFAGGDIVRGGATVILAMGDGRKAAAAMHSYLNGEQS